MTQAGKEGCGGVCHLLHQLDPDGGKELTDCVETGSRIVRSPVDSLNLTLSMNRFRSGSAWLMSLVLYGHLSISSGSRGKTRTYGICTSRTGVAKFIPCSCSTTSPTAACVPYRQSLAVSTANVQLTVTTKTLLELMILASAHSPAPCPSHSFCKACISSKISCMDLLLP